MLPFILFIFVTSLLSVRALPSVHALLSSLRLRPSIHLPSHSNSSLNADPLCFPLSPEWRLITVDDCTRSFDLVRADPKYRERQRWVSPSEQEWVRGPCAIVLFPGSSEARDEFALESIVGDIHEIITMCVASGSHAGGLAGVGPTKTWFIFVGRADRE